MGNNIVLPVNQVNHYNNLNISGLDSQIVHTKNSLGFRGDQMLDDFHKKTSIIAVGGSTTECTYISDGEDWVSILGKKLKSKNNDIWVNNAGLNGHSTYGHQVLVNQYLKNIKPDYILFMVGCNDVEREKYSYYDSLSTSKNSEFVSRIKRKSILYNLAVSFLRQKIAENRNLGLGHTAIDTQNLDFVDSINHRELLEMKSTQEKYLKGYAERLEKLILNCRKNGIEPILITQPTLVGFGTDPKSKIDLEKVIYCDPKGGRFYWEKLKLYNQITRKLSEKHNCFLIDLADELPKSTEYFYDCIHFTNKGCEKVAEVIFQNLNTYDFDSK